VLHRTLVRLIFAFQAVNITTMTAHVALIAVPLLIQVYFNASLTYGLMRLFKVEYAIAAHSLARALFRAGRRHGDFTLPVVRPWSRRPSQSSARWPLKSCDRYSLRARMSSS
jgi:hypothetical protein